MALDSKQGNCSNTPELLKAMVNEFIVGAIVDYDGNKWLVVKSGYAIVFGRHGAYWRESPTAVKALIDKRRADLGKWSADLADLALIADA